MVKNREDKSVQKACTKRFLYQKLDGLMTALLMQHSIYALYSIPGLQNTLLGYSLIYEIMRKEFIQIPHNGDNHWVTVSTVGLQSSHISINDSLHSPLSNFTKCYIVHR